MSIDRMHGLLADISGHFHIDILSNPAVLRSVNTSLAAHGKLGGREMPLKSPLVFWLVLMLTLHRHRSIPNTFGILVEACRGLARGLSRRAVTDGGLARARQRLGAAPFQAFFREQATAKRREWLHGFRPLALDGVRLNMPDSEKNLERFPRQNSGRGRSAWPQMLGVCLLDIGDRHIVDAAFDNIHGSERALGRQLWQALHENDLLVEDRGFFKKADLWQLNEAKMHFVCKMPVKAKVRVLQSNGPGDYLIELRGRRPRRDGEVPDCNTGRPGETKKFKLVVRLLVYRLNGTEHRIVTNVFDREVTPDVCAKIYHWRWDVELAYDELKTHMMAVHHGKAKTVFRSKSPALVEQEFWAMLATYNLIRGLMAEAAQKYSLNPLELSLTDCLAVVEDSLLPIQKANSEDLPRLHRRLLRDMAECQLDRPRRKRIWPRVVKAKMSNFRVKQAHHHEQKLEIVLEFPPLERIAS